MHRLALAVISIFLLSSSFAFANEETFLFVVSSSESKDSRLPKLKYSADDALRFVEAVNKSTDLNSKNIIKLENPTLAAFQQALKDLNGLIDDSSLTRRRLLFYFTGHADTEGLHFADGFLKPKALQAVIQTLDLETKIVFLDSCYSGRFLKKGVQKAPVFEMLKIDTEQPSGTIFLSATSSTEVAYELEELKGSLFTHHLALGLLGHADTDQDDLITFEELYHYIYKESQIQALALPIPSVPKPEFSIELAGKGRLVVSNLKKEKIPVVLAEDIGGELNLISDYGLKIAEIKKTEPKVLTINLYKGNYLVTLNEGGKIFSKRFIVGDQTLKIARQDFSPDSQLNTAYILKGRRESYHFGMRIGASKYTFSSWGGSGEAFISSPSKSIEGLDLKTSFAVGYQRNDFEYMQANGKAMVLMTNLYFHTQSPIAGLGLTWGILLGAGGDYIQFNWDEGSRHLDPFMGKLGAGFEFSLLNLDGLTYQVQFRREWPFATDKGNHDTYVFGKNLLQLGVEF